MTTQEKIAEIIKEQYHDFKGSKMLYIKLLHNRIKESSTDEEYLSFLEKAQKENPRPVYKISAYPNT